MKKMVVAVGLVLLLAAPCNAEEDKQTQWDSGMWDAGRSLAVQTFTPEFEVVSYTENTGSLTLKLTITYSPKGRPKATCDIMMMTVYPFGGLTYNGPDTLLIPFRTENPYSMLFELIIPPNDTSFLIFRQECDNVARHYGRYFMTTGDTLVTDWGIGWGRKDYSRELVDEWTLRHKSIPREDYDRAKREWEERQEQLRRFKGKSTTGPVMNPEDSGIVETLSDRGKRLWGWMRQAERQGPLVNETRQEVWIDGQCYVRSRGETLFKHIPGKTTEEIQADAQRYWDSLAANPPNNVYDVILDLSDPDDHDFARSLVDSLVPTDSLGSYRAVMDRPTLIKLTNKGLKYRPANQPPYAPPDSTRPNRPEGNEPKKKSGGGVPSSDGQNRLFFEGFEGAWPGDWYVGDDDAGSGVGDRSSCLLGSKMQTRPPNCLDAQRVFLVDPILWKSYTIRCGGWSQTGQEFADHKSAQEAMVRRVVTISGQDLSENGADTKYHHRRFFGMLYCVRCIFLARRNALGRFLDADGRFSGYARRLHSPSR